MTKMESGKYIFLVLYIRIWSAKMKNINHRTESPMIITIIIIIIIASTMEKKLHKVLNAMYI